MLGVGIPIGAQPVILASGQQMWPLSADEALVLTGYRIICHQGGGILHLEMRGGLVRSWSVQPEVGTPTQLNAARGRLRD